jgi:hypothetical protein
MKLETRTKNCHGNYIYVYDLFKDIEGLQSIPSTTINHFINLNQSVLNYKMIIEDTIIFNLNIDLNLIKQDSNFNKDQMIIGITDKLIDTLLSTEDNSNPYNVSKYELVNSLKETYLTKDPFIETASYDGNKCPFKIFVPSKSTSFENYSILVYTDNSEEPEITHVYDSDTLDLEVSPLSPWRDIISDITITPSKQTISEDDTVTLTLTSEDTSVTEVYAEAVFGMLSKTRIALTNGVGTVKVMSLGLSVGDPVRIKFGYAFFTGVAEYTNTVT